MQRRNPNQQPQDNTENRRTENRELVNRDTRPHLYMSRREMQENFISSAMYAMTISMSLLSLMALRSRPIEKFITISTLAYFARLLLHHENRYGAKTELPANANQAANNPMFLFNSRADLNVSQAKLMAQFGCASVALVDLIASLALQMLNVKNGINARDLLNLCVLATSAVVIYQAFNNDFDAKEVNRNNFQPPRPGQRE